MADLSVFLAVLAGYFGGLTEAAVAVWCNGLVKYGRSGTAFADVGIARSSRIMTEGQEATPGEEQYLGAVAEVKRYSRLPDEAFVALRNAWHSRVSFYVAR
ncbi:hypothetical protein CC85DRAFT_23575 [Cutaneotrichosporon oleaginosum]|uniref:Uncharacterized protein n=1 Tax=Cutaneotrichosporon oleaginosum TaxID=879819 RepID=A0A0J0XT07_9TREE|nr:uncharacterized protein CC85DRAFT_23575 [Cutaneotrichosporon oleaginosum]KLT44210.1 hypothetical protein CC85DRAFT_23575 [Cutaneotrichosporon oleaginosum]TXT11621.1 hypothetical protein COLE_02031 [Cutaneotrichosporon oleaginosum]